MALQKPRGGLCMADLSPGKQQRSVLSFASCTRYNFLGVFWTFLTARPFFCGAPSGPGQNKCGEPLHMWDKRLDHNFCFSIGIFFFFLLFFLFFLVGVDASPIIRYVYRPALQLLQENSLQNRRAAGKNALAVQPPLLLGNSDCSSVWVWSCNISANYTKLFGYLTQSFTWRLH